MTLTFDIANQPEDPEESQLSLTSVLSHGLKKAFRKVLGIRPKAPVIIPLPFDQGELKTLAMTMRACGADPTELIPAFASLGVPSFESVLAIVAMDDLPFIYRMDAVADALLVLAGVADTSAAKNRQSENPGAICAIADLAKSCGIHPLSFCSPMKTETTGHHAWRSVARMMGLGETEITAIASNYSRDALLLVDWDFRRYPGLVMASRSGLDVMVPTSGTNVPALFARQDIRISRTPKKWPNLAYGRQYVATQNIGISGPIEAESIEIEVDGVIGGEFRGNTSILLAGPFRRDCGIGPDLRVVGNLDIRPGDRDKGMLGAPSLALPAGLNVSGTLKLTEFTTWNWILPDDCSIGGGILIPGQHDAVVSVQEFRERAFELRHAYMTHRPYQDPGVPMAYPRYGKGYAVP